MKKEHAEAAEYLEDDAKFLFKQADIYFNRGGFGDQWLSEVVRTNAQHSLDLAEQYRQGLIN